MVDGDEFRQHKLGREEEISWLLGREIESTKIDVYEVLMPYQRIIQGFYFTNIMYAYNHESHSP